MMPDTTLNPAEKRERRPRRWLLYFVVLLGVIVISLCIWNVLERQGLARRIAALRDGGVPAEPADLRSPPVADESNAVIELRAAAKLIDSQTEKWKAANELYSLRLPFSEKDLAVLRDAIEPNAAAMPLVEAAMGKSDVDWGLSFQSPMILIELPDLRNQRDLANLLRFDALVAHQAGDDATAFGRIEQLLFISRAVARQPFIIGQLVALGISGIAYEVVDDMAPDLRIGSDPGSASEAQVRQIIEHLLDESAARAGMIRGLQGERVTAADSIKAMAEGRLTKTSVPSLGSVVSFKPFAYRNASGAIDHMNALIEVARGTSNWPNFRDRFAATSTPVKRSPRMYLIAGIFVPSIERTVEQHYRIAARRRMSAIVLAISLYRAKHSGELPPNLDALVPEFLPAVPLDPLAGSSVPIGYNTDPARPRLYSVGTNGVDDGGRPIDESKPRVQEERLSDEVVDLSRQPKPLEPEPEADSE
jgi:hypothetical protein